MTRGILFPNSEYGGRPCSSCWQFCCPTQSNNHSTNVLQSFILACRPASAKMKPASNNPAPFKSHPWCCEGESHVCLACSIEVGTKVRPCTTPSEANSYSCRNSLGPRHNMLFHCPNMETSTSARTHTFPASISKCARARAYISLNPCNSLQQAFHGCKSEMLEMLETTQVLMLHFGHQCNEKV